MRAWGAWIALIAWITATNVRADSSGMSALKTAIRARDQKLLVQVVDVDQHSVTVSIKNLGGEATGPLGITAELAAGKEHAGTIEQWIDDLKPDEWRMLALPLSSAIAGDELHGIVAVAYANPDDWKVFAVFPFEHSASSYSFYMGAAIVILLLGLALYYVQVYWNPVVIRVTRRPEMLKELPLDRLPEVSRALERARRTNSTLTAIKLPEIRWARVLKGAGSAREAATAFADAIGGTLKEPLGDAAWLIAMPPLRLRFADKAAVMVVDGPRFEDGQAQRRVASILRDGAGPTRMLVLDRTDAQNAAAVLREVPGATFVVLSSDDLRDLLLADNPRYHLEAVIARQVSVSELSPYRTAGGVEVETFFFGRERELRTITDQGLRNFLVVGPRQMGKSTLLKAVERRLRARPDVEVRYLVLGGPELLRPMLARLEPDRPRDAVLPSFEQVAAGTRERPRIWLIDEADELIAADTKAGYPTLRTMRALAEEGRAYFVLAGFWELYRAAVFDETGPLRNFAETLRLPPLEPDASLKLVVEPMRALGLSWDSDGTTSHLIEQTGRRANLIVLACKGMIESLSAETRTLTRVQLDNVFAEARDLRDQSRRWRGSVPLHRAVVRQSLLLGKPTREELRSALQARGARLTGKDFDEAIDHVELSYVLVADGDGRLYCPVPLMQRYIEAERSLELGLKEDLDDLASGRTEAPPAA